MGEFRKEERIKEGPGQSPGEIWFNWWVEEKEVVKKKLKRHTGRNGENQNILLLILRGKFSGA